MIDLTPLDVRKKRGDFRRILRGYDPEEVDTFMDLIAERFEELVRENLTLSEKTERLESQLTALEGRESAVQEALVSAQKLREEVKEQSRRDAEVLEQQASRSAELLKAEADAEINRRLGEAEGLIRERQRALEDLERSRLKFLKSFRGLLERELDAVDVEEARRPLEETPLELEFRGWMPDLEPMQPADLVDEGEDGWSLADTAEEEESASVAGPDDIAVEGEETEALEEPEPEALEEPEPEAQEEPEPEEVEEESEPEVLEESELEAPEELEPEAQEESEPEVLEESEPEEAEADIESAAHGEAELEEPQEVLGVEEDIVSEEETEPTREESTVPGPGAVFALDTASEPESGEVPAQAETDQGVAGDVVDEKVTEWFTGDADEPADADAVVEEDDEGIPGGFDTQVLEGAVPVGLSQPEELGFQPSSPEPVDFGAPADVPEAQADEPEHHQSDPGTEDVVVETKTDDPDKEDTSSLPQEPRWLFSLLKKEEEREDRG